nr:polysaccharide biosynthesis C-terminal domain-containing protein [Clostridia bacterium]
SLINSIYSFGITFALSGINLASSRLCAEAIGCGENERIRPVMFRCVLYALLFGTAAGAGLIILAPFICKYLISDGRALVSLNALAFGLPALSVTSALNGYFNAVKRVSKSASAQILEQLFRIVVTVMLLFTFTGSTETACLYISFAVVLSELLVFVYSALMYRIDIRLHGLKRGTKNEGSTRALLGIALPVAFSSYIRSGLVTIEHMLIPMGLKRSGASAERSLASYGMLSGMALPVVLFPQAFLSAFSGLLIPEVAEFRVRHNYDKIRSIMARVFKITLWFSVGVSGVILCFSYELSETLYDSIEAGAYIRLLAPLIPVMYLDTAVDSVLKGMNEQLYSMRINIADAFISVVLVTFLIPSLGIKGYLITIYVSEILNTACSIVRLVNITGFRFRLFDWLILPLMCVVGACMITRLLVGCSGILFSYNIVEVIVCLSISVFIYIVMLCVTGSVGVSDIRWMKSIIK